MSVLKGIKRIVQKIKPVRPTAPDRMRPQKIKIITLTLREIRNLHTSKKQIGPLTCKQWHKYLEKHFKNYSKNPYFSDYIKDFSDIFLHPLDIKTFEKDLKGGAANSFLFGFPASAYSRPKLRAKRFIQNLLKKIRLKRTAITENEVIGSAQIFLLLKDLSLRIAQARQGEIPQLIQTTNQMMQGISESEDYGLNYTVMVIE